MLTCARVSGLPAAVWAPRISVRCVDAGLSGSSRWFLRSASFSSSTSNGGPTIAAPVGKPLLVPFHSFLSSSPRDVEALKARPAVQALLEKAAQEKRTVTLFELSHAAGVKKLVGTPMHNAMLDHIEKHARNVTDQNADGTPFLQGRSGLNVSCVFVGQKGGGKSTCLEAGALLLPLVHPNLVTVYCDMSKAAKGRFLRDPLFIERLLVSALVRSGVDTPQCTEALLQSDQPPARNDGPVTNIIGFEEVVADLKASDKRLLVMLDEFEHVFQAVEEEFKTRYAIVDAVAQLANSRSGCIVTELCGSSTHLYSLITAQARKLKDVADLYPVVKISNSMNGSKLPSVHLPSALPNDIDGVKNLLRVWKEETALLSSTVLEKLQSEEGLEEVASLCLFRGGSAARDVEGVVKTLDQEPRRQETPAVNASVFDNVMNVLVKKNKQLLNMVKGCSLVLDANNKKGPPLPKNWWTEMQGVSQADLVSTLGSVKLNADTDTDSAWSQKKIEVESYLQEFYNAGFLRAVTPGTKDTVVFPTSAAQLVLTAAQRTSQPLKGWLLTKFDSPMKQQVDVAFKEGARIVVEKLILLVSMLVGGGLVLWFALQPVVEKLGSLEWVLRNQATVSWGKREIKQENEGQREGSDEAKGSQQGG